MPVPTITQPTTPRTIARGQAFSLQLAASESPTSWGATSLPAGLSISSGGLISGTPTVAAWYEASVTATNGTGTSDAITIGFLVLDEVTGLAANSLALPIDWDLVTGKLSVPGVSGPEPANYPPAASGEQAEILTLKAGNRRDLSIGLLMAGVLQEPDDLTHLYVSLKNALSEDEPGVLLSTAPTSITVTGADTTARHEASIYLDESALSSWISDGEIADGQQTYFTGLLELELAIASDARDFSATDTYDITSINEGDTVDHTFSVDLTDEIAAAIAYDVTVEFVFPSDTAMNVTLSGIVTATWGGSAFTAAILSGLASAVGSASGSSWDATCSVESVTGDAAGFDLAARVVSESLGSLKTINVDVTDYGSIAEDGGGAGIHTFEESAAAPDWQFYGAGDVPIGSPFSLSDGNTAAEIKTAIETAISETLVSVVLYYNGHPSLKDNQIEITFADDTAVTYLVENSDPAINLVTTPLGDTFTDADIILTVTGREMPERSTSITSQSAPVRIVRRLRSS